MCTLYVVCVCVIFVPLINIAEPKYSHTHTHFLFSPPPLLSEQRAAPFPGPGPCLVMRTCNTHTHHPRPQTLRPWLSVKVIRSHLHTSKVQAYKHTHFHPLTHTHVQSSLSALQMQPLLKYFFCMFCCKCKSSFVWQLTLKVKECVWKVSALSPGGHLTSCTR